MRFQEREREREIRAPRPALPKLEKKFAFSYVFHTQHRWPYSANEQQLLVSKLVTYYSDVFYLRILFCRTESSNWWLQGEFHGAHGVAWQLHLKVNVKMGSAFQGEFQGAEEVEVELNFYFHFKVGSFKVSSKARRRWKWN